MNIVEFAKTRKMLGGTGGGSGGGPVSWNDLTDKPFGEVVGTTNSITWDGNPEGKEVVSVGSGAVAVKVSDLTITTADVIGGSYTVTSFNPESPDDIIAIDESMIIPVADGLSFIGNMGNIVLVDKDEVNFNGIIFTRGIYFLCVEGFFYISILTLSSDIEVLVIKTLDEKYLPAAGVTKFYEVAEDAGRLHMSIDTSVETRVHSKDIDAAIARGTIVIYAVYESGSLDYILYPAYIRLGVSGYAIGAYMGHDLLEFKTSDFEDSEAGPS